MTRRGFLARLVGVGIASALPLPPSELLIVSGGRGYVYCGVPPFEFHPQAFALTMAPLLEQQRTLNRQTSAALEVVSWPRV